MSLLSGIVQAAVAIFSLIRKKPSWTDIATSIIPQVFIAVDKAIEFGGYNTKQKFDEFLELLDLKTGIDAGAVDLFKNITPQGEEEFFDGLIAAARAYGYARIGVPGYSVTPESG